MQTDPVQSQAENQTPAVIPPKRKRSRWLIIGAIVGGLLIGLFFILRPKVELIVVPNNDIFSFHTVITVNADEAAAALRTEPMTIHGSAGVNTTGVLPVGLTWATGTVVLLNNTDEPLVLPAMTRFSTDTGIVFNTTERVTVPPRDVVYDEGQPVGLHAGRAEASVRAAEPGTSGNVEVGAIRVVPEHLSGISVRNTTAFTGGTDTILSAVSPTDVEAAVEAVHDALNAQLRDMTQQRGRQTPDTVFMAADWSEEPAVTLSHQIGDPSHTLRASATATANTVWLDTKHFYSQVAASIPARLPIGYTWEQEAGFNVTVVGYDENEGVLRLHTDVPIIPLLDEYQLAQTVVGRTVPDAQARLRQRFDVKHIQVYPADTAVLPDWALWIRIRVRGDYTGLQFGAKDGR